MVQAMTTHRQNSGVSGLSDRSIWLVQSLGCRFSARVALALESDRFLLIFVSVSGETGHDLSKPLWRNGNICIYSAASSDPTCVCLVVARFHRHRPVAVRAQRRNCAEPCRPKAAVGVRSSSPLRGLAALSLRPRGARPRRHQRNPLRSPLKLCVFSGRTAGLSAHLSLRRSGVA